MPAADPMTAAISAMMDADGANAPAAPAEGAAAEPAPDRPAKSKKLQIRVEDLTGAQRSAILLIALGVEAAAAVLPLMQDDEVEAISIEIARMRNVSSDVVEAVLVDFRQMALAKNYVAQGGVNYAREVLQQALGESRAEEILMKIEAAMEVSAFHLLQTVETTQLTNFLQREHPQTAALILAHINTRKAAEIIAGINGEQQHEIVYRLATMGKTSPELLRDIEEVIRQQIGSVFGAEVSTTGGVEKVAQILNSTGRMTERAVMDALRARSPEIANQVKGMMFTFDDLVQATDRDLQRILVEVEQKNLILSLRGASDELKRKILSNVSERVSETIKEELELMGPVRVRDVEDAQQAVLQVASALEEQEEISLMSGGAEQLI